MGSLGITAVSIYGFAKNGYNRGMPQRTHAFNNLLQILLIATLMVVPFHGSARAASPPAESLYLIERLCGRLVFLKDIKTDLTTIGLQPCGGGKPYIFHVGPKDLYDYYQFENVKIGVGDVIRTAEWGNLNTYIVGFDSYRPINTCSDCGKAFVPSKTPSPTLTSQYTATVTATRQFPPTPTPWSEEGEATQEPSPSPLIATDTITQPADTGTPAPTEVAPPTETVPDDTEVVEESTPTPMATTEGALNSNAPILLTVGAIAILLSVAGVLSAAYLIRRGRNRKAP